jgi:hypothetical protein
MSLRNKSGLKLHVDFKFNTEAEGIVLERMSAIQICVLLTKTEFL